MAIGRIPEPGTGIPESIVDAKGDIVTATAADTPARLAVGTNEQRLVADSGEATGLKYVADTTNYAIAAKGDLLVGTAADTLAVLSVGTNGHTLVADSSTATGLKWAAAAGGGGMTLLSTTTLSGATVTLSSISQDYNSLFMVFNRITNSTANGKFYLNPNAAGTNSRLSGVESGTAFSNGYGGLFQTQNNWDRSNADNGMSLRIDNYTASLNYNKAVVWSGYYFTSGSIAAQFIVGGIVSESSGALTSIVLSNTGGNWAGGTVLLYGVK